MLDCLTEIAQAGLAAFCFGARVNHNAGTVMTETSDQKTLLMPK